MASPTVLSLQDVTIRYGERVAVDALCLEVRRGEVYGLLGPNGSGKSSTLGAIVGAVALAAGEVRVAGRCEAEAPLEYRRRIGLVPQEIALYEELTAEQNLAFFGGLYGLRGAALRRRIGEVLAFVRLTEQAGRAPRTFSGGMQRRLNLAAALLHEPDLLLLDEPTVGLDIQSRDAIFASLRELRDRGAALVFTTHHLEEAELLCDRLAIMDHGRLIAEGTLDELCEDLPEPAAYRTDEPRPPAAVTGRRAPGPDGGPRGLERVFLELTGKGLRER